MNMDGGTAGTATRALRDRAPWDAGVWCGHSGALDKHETLARFVTPDHSQHSGPKTGTPVPAILPHGLFAPAPCWALGPGSRRGQAAPRSGRPLCLVGRHAGKQTVTSGKQVWGEVPGGLRNQGCGLGPREGGCPEGDPSTDPLGDRSCNHSTQESGHPLWAWLSS